MAIRVNAILPHAIALFLTRTQHAHIVHRLAPFVHILDPIVACRRCYIKHGKQYGHVYSGDQAQLKLAKFGHEHHFVLFCLVFLFYLTDNLTKKIIILKFYFDRFLITIKNNKKNPRQKKLLKKKTKSKNG